MRLAFVIIGSAMMFTVGCRETVMKEGRWSVARLQTVIPESGARRQQLMRAGRGVVAEFVSLPRIYGEEDCVIFVGRSSRAMWTFVCGDNRPMAVVPYTSSDTWFPDRDGLSRWTRITASGGSARLVKATYRVADLARGDLQVTNVLSPISGEVTNPATGEPAWLFALRTADCASFGGLPNVPLHESRPYDSPLIEAVKMGKRCEVEVLVRRGADVNTRSSAGDTALHEAVNQRNSEMVEALLPYADYATKSAARERARSLGQEEILEVFDR